MEGMNLLTVCLGQPKFRFVPYSSYPSCSVLAYPLLFSDLYVGRFPKFNFASFTLLLKSEKKVYLRTAMHLFCAQSRTHVLQKIFVRLYTNFHVRALFSGCFCYRYMYFLYIYLAASIFFHPFRF